MAEVELQQDSAECSRRREKINISNCWFESAPLKLKSLWSCHDYADVMPGNTH